jgi:dipeptide transport system permease protein
MAEARVIKVRSGPRLWLSGAWLTLFALLAIFAPLIMPHDPPG